MNITDYKLFHVIIWVLLVMIGMTILYFAWKVIQGVRFRRQPSRGLRRQNAIRYVRSTTMNSTVSCGSIPSTSLLFPSDLQLCFTSPPPAYDDPPPKYEEVVETHGLNRDNQQPIERI